MKLNFINNIDYEINEFIIKENTIQFQKMLEKAEIWKIKHDTQFEKSKYLLIYFIRNYRILTNAIIKINNAIIQFMKEIKYLKITFNQILKFKLYLNQMIKKEMKFI